MPLADADARAAGREACSMSQGYELLLSCYGAAFNQGDLAPQLPAAPARRWPRAQQLVRS